MAGEKVVKRSCSFCVHEERDSLEEQMLQDMISAKQLDKDMGWRTNTSDRHYRNHMGEYHMASNTDCALCTTPIRGDYERTYFDDGRDRKSTRLNSSHGYISYAVFCLKKKKKNKDNKQNKQKQKQNKKKKKETSKSLC